MRGSFQFAESPTWDFLTEPFWCGQFVHCSKHPSLRKAKGCGLLRSLTDILFMMYSVRAAHAQNMPFEKVPAYFFSGGTGLNSSS